MLGYSAASALCCMFIGNPPGCPHGSTSDTSALELPLSPSCLAVSSLSSPYHHSVTYTACSTDKRTLGKASELIAMA